MLPVPFHTRSCRVECSKPPHLVGMARASHPEAPSPKAQCPDIYCKFLKRRCKTFRSHFCHKKVQKQAAPGEEFTPGTSEFG